MASDMISELGALDEFLRTQGSSVAAVVEQASVRMLGQAPMPPAHAEPAGHATGRAAATGDPKPSKEA